MPIQLMSQALLHAVKDALTTASLTNSEGTHYLDIALRGLEVPAEKQSITPCTLNIVDEYFEPAVALAKDPQARRVGNALYALRNELQWQQSYDNYAGDPFMEKFRSNFAHTLLTWPGDREHSLFHSETVALAVTIQAPHTYYPPHVHKAVEFYYLIGGTATWLRGNEDWIERAGGSLFFHDTGVRHATQTAEDPLLSLTVWVNDFEGEPVIVRA